MQSAEIVLDTVSGSAVQVRVIVHSSRVHAPGKLPKIPPPAFVTVHVDEQLCKRPPAVHVDTGPIANSAVAEHLFAPKSVVPLMAPANPTPHCINWLWPCGGPTSGHCAEKPGKRQPVSGSATATTVLKQLRVHGPLLVSIHWSPPGPAPG